MLSQIVDTLIFITVAFYGVFPIGELLLGQMLAKVVLSAVLVPPLVYAFVAAGRALDRRGNGHDIPRILGARIAMYLQIC